MNLIKTLFGVSVSLLVAAFPGEADAGSRYVDPFTFGNPAFCTPKKPVNDFGLSGLPPLREAPESGDLPFGPKTVSLIMTAGPVLRVGEGVGFWLDSENYFGRTPLRWVVRSRLRSVGEAGESGSVVARGRKRIRIISAKTEVKQFLEPPRSPGFYLHEVEFLKFDGNALATYSSYIRVERSFWSVQLGLSRHLVRPGQRLLSRVENLGTEWVEYGEAFGVQRLRGEVWVHVRGALSGGWLLWGGFSGPGSSGRCSAFHVPRDFPPGQYRIVKDVERPLEPEGERSYQLTAPFEVVADEL